MPAVLVHGVPDTARSWDRLRAALDRTDVVALSLPGFGVATPTDWTATKAEYAAWLEAELVALGEPVDLVAHDWGALLAQRVASRRPDVIRTVALGSGPCDRAYEWHPMAQAWQTPDVGEQVMHSLLAMSADERADGLVAGGAPADLAVIQADDIDERMASCILALYRSAVTVGAEWEDAVAAMPSRPALVFHGADDPYLGTGVAERLAARLGGELVVFGDTSHWWAWERADEVAASLERLWA